MVLRIGIGTGAGGETLTEAVRKKGRGGVDAFDQFEPCATWRLVKKE